MRFLSASRTIGSRLQKYTLFRNWQNIFSQSKEKVYFCKKIMAMMVYHGSDKQIEAPQILDPNRALDFGRGFYTTLNEMQADSFARKVMDRNHSAKAIVNVYEVDIEKMKAELSNVWFDAPDEAWLDYVNKNRNGIDTVTCDFAFGPVANDDVFRTFAAYQAGVLTKEETIARLKVKRLYSQLTFKTDMSLTYLHFLKAYTV